MNAAKRQGYTILLVLAVLSLVGAALLVLADTSDSLALDGNRAYTDACKRNLTASGLAWLARHGSRRPKDDLAKGIDLDVKNLRQGRLRVAVTADGQSRITTECRSGRMVLKSDDLFSPAP